MCCTGASIRHAATSYNATSSRKAHWGQYQAHSDPGRRWELVLGVADVHDHGGQIKPLEWSLQCEAQDQRQLLYLSVALSLYLSACVSLSLFLYLSACRSFAVCNSAARCLFLCIWLFASVSISLPAPLYLCLPTSASLSRPLCISVSASFRPCLPTSASLSLPLCISASLPHSIPASHLDNSDSASLHLCLPNSLQFCHSVSIAVLTFSVSSSYTSTPVAQRSFCGP